MTTTAADEGRMDGYEYALDAEREAPEQYVDPADVPADAAVTAVRELLQSARGSWSEALVNAMGRTEVCRRYGLTAAEGHEWEQWLDDYDRGCVVGVRERLAELEAHHRSDH